MSTLKLKKTQEAAEAIAKAEKKLATGFFKRKPDYFSAAPLYEDAAKCYEVLGDKKKAVEYYQKSAECEYESGAIYAAGEKTQKAALLLSQTNDKKDYPESAKIYEQAAAYYRESNNPEKACEVLVKGGKLYENIDIDETIRLVVEACDLFNDSEQEIYSTDTHLYLLSAEVKKGLYGDAIKETEDMVEVYTKLNQPHNVWKLYLTQAILYLAQNDFPSAKATFEQHLQCSEYLRTKECEREERLLKIFEEFDEEAWVEMRDSNCFNNLEPQILKVAKHLQVTGGVAISTPRAGTTTPKPKPEPTKTTTTPSPAPASAAPPAPVTTSPTKEKEKEEAPELPKAEQQQQQQKQPKEEDKPEEPKKEEENEEEPDYGIDLC